MKLVHNQYLIRIKYDAVTDNRDGLNDIKGIIGCVSDIKMKSQGYINTLLRF